MGPQPADSNVLSGSQHRLWRAICLLLILMSAPIAGGILYQSLSSARERPGELLEFAAPIGIPREELRGLSTRGTRLVVKGSGHFIQQDRPDVVIKAIHEIVDQVRGKVGAVARDR